MSEERQWHRVTSMSQLRVGMIVRRVRDPDNEEWLQAGIRRGSIGVVAHIPETPKTPHPASRYDVVGVSYFDAPRAPDWHSENYWRCYQMWTPRIGDVVRLKYPYARSVPAETVCVVIDHSGGVWVIQSLTTGKKASLAHSHLNQLELLSDDAS